MISIGECGGSKKHLLFLHFPNKILEIRSSTEDVARIKIRVSYLKVHIRKIYFIIVFYQIKVQNVSLIFKLMQFVLAIPINLNLC